VGFELWVVNSGSIFSNLVITDSVEEAKAFAEKTFSSTFVEAEKAAKKELDEKNKPAETKEEDSVVDAKVEEDADSEPEDIDSESKEEL
jgi:calreticulin